MKKIVLIISLIAVLSFPVIFSSENVKAAPSTVTVDGNGFYYSIGNIFPSKIQLVGYDARAGKEKIYLNLEINTSDPLITTGNLDYNITVYDGTGATLGNTTSTSISVPSFPYNDTLVEVILSGPLPSNHSIVAEVLNFQ